MNFLPLLILFAFTSFSSPASADVLLTRAEMISPDRTERIEVTNFLAETEEDRLKIVGELKKILAADLHENVNLEPNFEEILTDTGRSPSSTKPGKSLLQQIAGKRSVIRRILPADSLKHLRTQFPKWFQKNYRPVFSLTRGTLNGAVTAWSLAHGGLPLDVFLVGGFVTGSMSGSLQYFNAWLRENFYQKSFAKYFPEGIARVSVQEATPFFRWYYMELGFVSIIDLTLSLLGHPTGKEFGDQASTAVKGVGSQGMWDTAINRVVKKNLAKTVAESARNKIILKGDLIALGFSLLSVATTVADIQNFPIANWSFGTIAATGAIYFGKVLHSEWRCKNTLAKPEPPKFDETTAIDLGNF